MREVSHLPAPPPRPSIAFRRLPSPPLSLTVGPPRHAPPSDSRYIEQRLEALNAKINDGDDAKHWPGGALIYWVVWDVFAFACGVAITTPFLISEIHGGHITTFGEALTDWRLRCALYFCKVVIALMSFPFLIFAVPLVQDWVTHVKPTGYDQAGNCVPRLSAAQIKAKFRQEFIEKRKHELVHGQAKLCGCIGDDWWDRILGVDMNYGLYYDHEEEHDNDPAGKKKKDTIVDAARKARMRQLRKERLPEATLLPVVHSRDPKLEGRLQITGDNVFMML